jgi:hypothetical protein
VQLASGIAHLHCNKDPDKGVIIRKLDTDTTYIQDSDKGYIFKIGFSFLYLFLFFLLR